MIYPTKFNKPEEPAEEKVFNALSKLPDSDFTTFYSQEFTSINPREKNEYEIDFIVVDHRNNRLNAILVIEVKGGNITFNGATQKWSQNGKEMNKAPNKQASSAMNNLVSRFRFLSLNIPFHWVLWFPDIQVRPDEWLPTAVSRDRLLDSNSVSYCSDALPFLFNEIIEKNPNEGAPVTDFLKLKDILLRSVGFFKPLHKEFEENENTFKKLTENQGKIFKYIDINPNICVQGPAGSGKTFIAYNKAIEFGERGMKVMYVCFNKTLATELRHRYRNLNLPREFEIEFTNFHFWALRIAEQNPTYKKEKADSEFFNTYIPNKAKEVINEPFYDAVIIDEGQDFRENWLELLNKILKKEGRFLFFMDENQDIFETFKGVPHHRNITKCHLEENCRNTKLIIEKLKETLPDVKMVPMEGTPDGQPIKTIAFDSNESQVNELDRQVKLLIESGIRPNQIIILTNNLEGISSLKGVHNLGGKKLISTYDREYGRDTNCIAQTTINVFKGLEADIVFILDAQNIENKNSFYTQASRAKQMLFIFKKNYDKI
ncbi:nuclease-related domain-containing DEAD/DEAH box helicase [Flavobacterium aciduliphilum]|uniref:DNA 3'-5' helicase II n=1 Tax=Flavobacterium aciduliphilum TaxID=1101402 RepID=A0A328YKT8_9FLAO|nr:nuclease-related domain-containing DEAD/DEAH box helicase [Flavobacterium aciduliphilum]RAR73703.1 nuclease-like protein [Flavobacterium aciduliphilum]